MVNSFTFYDLLFFAVFTLATIIFLYTRKHNLKREGLLYLYRTKLGIKLIESFTKKFSKILRPMQYLVVTSGYILMGFMVWMLVKFSWTYLTSPVAAKALKVPVLIPLVPYLPELFKLDFLPSFNFTYWIIVLALIAIPHEFAHGIFARLNRIKIHSTGFGFLGPFLAAFVEQDEKDMKKASKFAQLSLLAAGTFANVLTTILFAFIMFGFFSLAFVPAGINFNTYATTPINLSEITHVNGMPISSLDEVPILLNDSLTEITVSGENYFANPYVLELGISQSAQGIQVFDNSPAFNSRIKGAISEINGEKITTLEDLSLVLSKKSPGETIEVKTLYQESIGSNNIEELSYNLTLADRNGDAFLGVGFIPNSQSGVMGFIYSMISKIKDPFIFYESILGSFGWFVYYLLWWIVIICISVALVNMLPVGIFDGGRFFYITVWGLTGSEKVGAKAFEISTWLIIALVIALMLKWIFIFF